MSAVFERVAVVGLGLLGGSIARAAREREAAARVVGVSRRRESAREAVDAGFVDEASVDLARAAVGVDLLILATPVFAMAETLARAAPHLASGAIVTDVGSVKGPLAETLPGLLPEGVHYVGSHPMAGSHETGLGHARADLLENAACIVTRCPGTDAVALERVSAFWERLGARVLVRDPAAHDEEVAWVSHLPHAVAFAYAQALAIAPPGAAEVTGGGFRDFTRIAGSDPELWADILLTNRKALAGPLQETSRALARLSLLLESGEPEAVHRVLASAREALAFGRPGPDADAPSGGVAQTRGDNPEIQAAREAATKE